MKQYNSFRHWTCRLRNNTVFGDLKETSWRPAESERNYVRTYVRTYVFAPVLVQARSLECSSGFPRGLILKDGVFAVLCQFFMLSQDNITSTEAVMSTTTVNTQKKSFFRAVVSVKGESKRRFGTRHSSALESAKKLLSKFTERISAAAKNGCWAFYRGL